MATSPCTCNCDCQAATLKPYLTAVRHTLTAAMCLEDFSSQVVERHNKPEVEVRWVTCRLYWSWVTWTVVKDRLLRASEVYGRIADKSVCVSGQPADVVETLFPCWYLRYRQPLDQFTPVLFYRVALSLLPSIGLFRCMWVISNARVTCKYEGVPVF